MGRLKVPRTYMNEQTCEWQRVKQESSASRIPLTSSTGSSRADNARKIRSRKEATDRAWARPASAPPELRIAFRNVAL